MNNHVHLLVTPTRSGSVSRMMQAIGRRYVGSFNARYRRTGTLWEGRFKAALVDTDRYLLTCYRYIELNPVRARMFESPGEYRWSSHACNALGAHEARITPHEFYLAPGVDSATRQRARNASIPLRQSVLQLSVICAPRWLLVSELFRCRGKGMGGSRPMRVTGCDRAWLNFPNPDQSVKGTTFWCVRTDAG